MRALAIAAAVAMTSASATPPREDVTAEQFLRLVTAQQEAIRDVAFAFEGEVRSLGRDDDHEKKPPLPERFQGRYAYRSDGATFLENLYHFGGETPDQHHVLAMLKGKVEGADVTPDRFGSVPLIRRFPGGPGSLYDPNSPESYVFLWRLKRLRDVGDFGFRFLGWEDVAGHRCAKIEFAPHPHAGGPMTQELWVDLARGGHPLRIRNHLDGRTALLVEGIELGRFPLPSGEQVWFPVRGETKKFSRDGTYQEEPVTRVINYVLAGTLVFNQDIPDAAFAVEGRRFRPVFRAESPSGAAKAKAKLPTIDLDEETRKIDAELAEPGRRAKALDASASAREEASRWSGLTWAMAVGGLAAVGTAAILARRRG